jgi:hypothetical protein
MPADTKMSPTTKTALLGSIEKWEKIADATGVDRGAENCPLCQKFLKNRGVTGKACAGCPVKESTGMQYCDGTPYSEWLQRNPTTPRVVRDHATKRIALKEVKFLRSLLLKSSPKRTQPVGTTTVNEAIALLERARTQVGGDACLILSLTGSGIEMVGIDVLVIQKENESRYVEVRARLPKGINL